MQGSYKALGAALAHMGGNSGASRDALRCCLLRRRCEILMFCCRMHLHGQHCSNSSMLLRGIMMSTGLRLSGRLPPFLPAHRPPTAAAAAATSPAAGASPSPSRPTISCRRCRRYR